MNTIPEHIDELIASYLAGEASAEEMEIVDRWREENEEHQKYFRHLKIIFNQSASFRETIQFDTDEAWKNVRKGLQERKAPSIRRWDSDFPFLRIAAGVIVLIAAGLFTYRFFADEHVRPVEIFAGRETLSDTLPDGSNIFLNRESKIEYSFDTDRKAHITKLSGEAYFNIHHKGEVDFIVVAGETFIKDIGTSFNVLAYPNLNTIEVIVEEGEVLFYTSNDPGIRLKAHDKGTYNKTTGKFVVGSPEVNATAYKTRSFTFSNHTLGAVVKMLNGVYGTPLRIDENLEYCKLTVSFNDESIDEIAHVIAETLGLSIEEKDNVIWLHGRGCGEDPTK